MSGRDVVVVGGGLAGLTAALACADAGARVTLLERRSRLGGATWSKHHRGLGFEIDNGQHVFMRCCDRYRALLDRLGVGDRVVLQDRLAVPVARPGGERDWIRRTTAPPPLHLASSLLRFRPLRVVDRLRAARTARAFSSLDPDDPALDERSLGDWLRARGEPDHVIDGFWDLLIRSTLNARARDASLALAARVIRTGFLDSPGGADIGWSRVPLRALHADPAARALQRAGARLHLRAPVEKIEAVGVDGARVWSRGRAFPCDAVVLAVPHDVADGLAPVPGRRDDPPRPWLLGHSAIVNLHVVFDRRVMDVPLLAGLGSELQWIFDRSAAAGAIDGQYLTVSLSAGDAFLGLSQDELKARFEPGFHALLPRSRAARIVDFAVTCERSATFRQVPGMRRLRPPPGAALGAVHLAGAWTDTGWPATMEGAVRSGEAAARSVLARLAPAALGNADGAPALVSSSRALSFSSRALSFSLTALSSSSKALSSSSKAPLSHRPKEGTP